jgi:hypothetical protein
MWMSGPRDARRPAPRQHGHRDPGSPDRAAAAVTIAAAALVLAVLWPVVLVTAAAVTAAWAAGMHHARLLRAALWSASMTGAYAIAGTIQDRPWAPGRLRTWAEQPYSDYRHATTALIHGSVPAALLLTAPLAIPAGLAAAAGLWAWRCHQMTHGLGGSTALASVSWDTRQWKRQARAARMDARAPGRVPLLSRRGVPVGTVIRAVRAPWTRVLVIPAAVFTRHMIIIGITGSGKTVLMLRLWCGWLAAAARETSRHGAPPPLLIILDGKGGHDARRAAARARTALTAAGAVRFRLWPDEDTLSMWDIPPAALAVLLDQLVEHGEGNAAYYADAMAAAVRLAVLAPQGPPRSAAEFLDRLTPAWLEHAYAEGRPADLEKITAARPHLPSAVMRYSVLFDRLGPSLDGSGSLTEADVWYCILEGTAEPSIAEAQGMALTELAARAASQGQRTILLALDEYSAISRRVPLSNLYERGRSLGLGVQVSAQSWAGLGKDDDERQRLASTADGGIWLMRTPAPEPLVTLAGTRRVLEGSRKTIRASPGDEGNTHLAHTWIADPDRIRQLATGQAAYIRHGTAIFTHVAPAPAAGSPAPPASGNHNPGHSEDHGRHEHQDQDHPAVARALPQVDDVLGPGPAHPAHETEENP